MNLTLLIDFGSTYTKLRAVDVRAGTLIASGQGPSTVTTDINLGLDAALADMEARLGRLPHFDQRLASSSAAGGLRMITVGLVPELTAKAARLAALGAGAKVTGTYAFELTDADVAGIVAAAPDIVLLTGGTDGGNRAVIRANARRLAASALACPLVIAGNRNAADPAAADLREAGKQVVITGNVMPRYLELDIEPARQAIRRLFIDHIVHAKGIDRARGRFDAVLMPTPAAVLEGARCLAEGDAGTPGLGPLLVVDIGGSTTDVHSICNGEPRHSGIIYHGLPEPHAKRSVEGDLGMRHMARGITAASGAQAFAAETGLSSLDIERLLSRCDDDVEWLPQNPVEQHFDLALARCATRLAVSRHAGTLEMVYTPTGPASVQRGKDLGRVTAIIGTGGVLAHSPDPGQILAAAVADGEADASLKPRDARLLLDTDYSLYACGLLSSVDPAAALAFGLAALKPLAPATLEDHAQDTGSAH